MRGYLSELVKMVPFSMETISLGRNYWFHLAAVDSSVSNFTGSALRDKGILFSLMNFKKCSLIMMSRNFLLKGPA